jgi:hypothetical protein
VRVIERYIRHLEFSPEKINRLGRPALEVGAAQSEDILAVFTSTVTSRISRL